MSLPPSAVHPGVKSVLFALLTLLVSAAAFAANIDPKLDRAVREALPVCDGAKVTYAELPVRLPQRFTGTMVQVESANHECDGQFAAIVSPSGNLFLGTPWPIADEEGKGPAEKLKNFAWRNMQQNLEVQFDASKRTVDGLFRATLIQQTEYGKMPLEGVIDQDSKLFFFGAFRPMNGDVRTERMKAYESLVATQPARGSANAKVTVVEFSDFQCPSCMRASGYADTLLEKFGDKVRYVRYDLPLSNHAWAFPAALAGRAIYRQKPELFWEYKKQVYANQSGMNAFMFWDWARGFAEDHDLDLAKYDADLNSQELKDQILKGAGFALTNEVRATPSYMVNGSMVEAGEDGKALIAYVDSLLSK